MVSSLTRTKRWLLPLFAQSIPGVFFTRLKKLQVLKLAYNELEVLPEEIGMLLYARPATLLMALEQGTTPFASYVSP